MLLENYEYFNQQIPLILGFRELIVTNAQFVFYENMPGDWLDEKRQMLAHSKTRFIRELESIERHVYLNLYKRKDDESQYGKKLLELSARLSEEE